MLSLIQNGLGIGFLLNAWLETALSSGCVVRIPLAKEPPARRCSLIEDSSRPLSQPAAQLVNLLLEQEKQNRKQEQSPASTLAAERLSAPVFISARKS